MKRTCSVVAVSLLSAGLFSLFGASVAQQEKSLKTAVKTKKKGLIVSLSQELVATGEASAIRTVAACALMCDDYETERKVAGLLTKIPRDQRAPVHEVAINKSTDYRVKIVLSAVLRIYGDKASRKALHTLVRDPMPAVKLSAIGQLVKIGDITAIDVFISELKRYNRAGGVVVADLRQALNTLTGEQFANPDDWRKWWATRKATFTRKDVQKAQVTSKGRTMLYGQNTFFGHELVSKKILFILDMSGSMHKRDAPPAMSPGDAERGTATRKKSSPRKRGKAGEPEYPKERERLYRVQQELIKTIKALTPDTRFTVMAFNHKIKMLTDMPTNASAAHKKAAVQFARSFKAEGETWTDKAFVRAFEMGKAIDTIYFLSDGAPRRKNKLLPIEPILDVVKKTNRFGKVKIYTIGFVQVGRTMEKFLRRLAGQNYGTYKGLE